MATFTPRIASLSRKAQILLETAIAEQRPELTPGDQGHLVASVVSLIARFHPHRPPTPISTDRSPSPPAA